MMFRKPYFWVSLFVFSFAILVLHNASSYDYWLVNQPGPGFFPVWLGAALVILSIILFFSSLRSGQGGAFRVPDRDGLKKLLVIIGAQVSFVLLVSAVGFMITSILFLFTLYLFFPHFGKLTSVALSVAIVIVFVLLFQKWLAVPLPSGCFGI